MSTEVAGNARFASRPASSGSGAPHWANWGYGPERVVHAKAVAGEWRVGVSDEGNGPVGRWVPWWFLEPSTGSSVGTEARTPLANTASVLWVDALRENGRHVWHLDLLGPARTEGPPCASSSVCLLAGSIWKGTSVRIVRHVAAAAVAHARSPVEGRLSYGLKRECMNTAAITQFLAFMVDRHTTRGFFRCTIKSRLP